MDLWICNKLSGTSDELKSMSLDESTSCNWSIYGGDGRSNDGDVEKDYCTGHDVSKIADTEETDLTIDWRRDGDDADLEGVLLFDVTNYENGSQCDDAVTSIVDKCLQAFLQSLLHESDGQADVHSDEKGCKCGFGWGRLFGIWTLSTTSWQLASEENEEEAHALTAELAQYIFVGFAVLFLTNPFPHSMFCNDSFCSV